MDQNVRCLRTMKNFDVLDDLFVHQLVLVLYLYTLTSVPPKYTQVLVSLLLIPNDDIDLAATHSHGGE